MIEMEKSKVHVVVELIQYVSNAVLSKTIIKKIIGNITASSFDKGADISEKTSSYDTYMQIIDGTAQVHTSYRIYKLTLGEGIVIPANASPSFGAEHYFNMISTVNKSGF